MLQLSLKSLPMSLYNIIHVIAHNQFPYIASLCIEFSIYLHVYVHGVCCSQNNSIFQLHDCNITELTFRISSICRHEMFQQRYLPHDIQTKNLHFWTMELDVPTPLQSTAAYSWIRQQCSSRLSESITIHRSVGI